MRNSKAKKLIGRAKEMKQRRTSRDRVIIEHKPRAFPTGQFNMDGTPGTIKIPMVQLINVYDTYKYFKGVVKGS